MKISIITVCFNSEKTIERTIKSVINQNYKDIEYIIVDGRSSDDTIKIINKYKESISTVISEHDLGIYDAMNKGINIATGDIIAILNSDDYFKDENILKKISHCFINEKVNIVYGNIEYFNDKNEKKVTRVWSPGDYDKKSFTSGWHPPHPAFFVRKKIYEKYGVFDINIKISADFDLMLRFMEVNKVSSKYLNEVLVRMAAGGESGKSFKNIAIGNINVLKSFRKYNIKINKISYLIMRILPKLIILLKDKIKIR